MSLRPLSTYRTPYSSSTSEDRINVILAWIGIISILLLSVSSLQAQIEVYAGSDQSICYGAEVDLTALGAYITGDVDNGNWFTTGDGIFVPSGTDMGVFSTATAYLPGTDDQLDGIFNLILVSDDPDGIGPMIEVSDMLTVTFQNAPALACNNDINVTLNINCQQEITIDMLVANPSDPLDRYIITLHDESDNIIPDNILTGDHIDQDIEYIVGHECTQVTCSGTLNVTDNYAPVFVCIDEDIVCDEDAHPDVIGLPLPANVAVTPDGDQSYVITDWDACGTVALSYTDSETIPSCNHPLDRIVNRTWIAIDANDNTSYCTQTIHIERITLEEVIFPTNLDDIASSALLCSDEYPLDDNGYPDPTHTGSPSPSTCNHIDYLYSDTELELCGGGYKVLREWQAIDWCLTETEVKNQVIKVIDATAPTFDCVADVTVSTSPYQCHTDQLDLTLPTNIQDCSEVQMSIVVESIPNFVQYMVTESNGNFSVEDLPMGTYQVTYTLTDDCSNTSECLSQITVLDNVPPYPICDEFTSVSITANGMGRVYANNLDDLSTDNCEIENFEVAKMSDSCGHGLTFGPYADFCCEEVGDTIMVALRVTDTSGNSNTCMVTVYVEDHLEPEIVCPTDLTISCDTYYDLSDLSPFGTVVSDPALRADIILEDEYNTGVVGLDGYFTDNCSATVSETVTVDIECYEGIITRTFTVIDEFGLTDICTQYITIANPDPIVESDISWPLDITMEGCEATAFDTSATGIPMLDPNVNCGAIGLDYYDELFPLSDTACYKIIRHWTVIDWCQYDPDTGVGYWTDNQVIKLIDNEAPALLSCDDILLCAFDDDCASAIYSDTLQAVDACTDSLYLLYTWSIDIDSDGDQDLQGSGQLIEEILPIGSHMVNYQVSDGCGNLDQCSYAIEVNDCKAPTPYCYSSITTVLMPTSGSVTIWADDFDFGSFDNCTASDDLIFSIGPDIGQQSITLDCDDLINGSIQYLELDMYVTDEYGNQDYCTIELILQDNDDTCLDEDPDGIIKGNIRTINGERINQVAVAYHDINLMTESETYTNEAGKYTTTAIHDQVPYQLVPDKSNEKYRGVSSIDLALIQRHILGFQEFDSPHKIIAADFNRSENVSLGDVVALRKFILGIVTELPGGGSPWEFVAVDWIFQDTLSPWGYQDFQYIKPLIDTVRNVDFTAIKLGDVNDSYTAAISEQQESTTRSTVSLSQSILHTEDELSLTVRTTDVLRIDAWQMQFSMDPSMIVIGVKDAYGEWLSADQYSWDRGSLRIIDTYLQAEYFGEDDALFTIVCAPTDVVTVKLILDDRDKFNMIYQDLSPMNVVLESIEYDLPEDKTSYTLLSNPSRECIIVPPNQGDEASIVVVNKLGQEIYKSVFTDGDLIRISTDVFEGDGLYYILIETDQSMTTLEYIHIK